MGAPPMRNSGLMAAWVALGAPVPVVGVLKPVLLIQEPAASLKVPSPVPLPARTPAALTRYDIGKLLTVVEGLRLM